MAFTRSFSGSFKTLNAKFAGTCKRCGQQFPAGTKIRWAKGKGSYHLAADCPASEHYKGDEADEQQPPQFGEGQYRTCAQGGRCEDYPCCGCDGLHGVERFRPEEPPDPYDREY